MCQDTRSVAIRIDIIRKRSRHEYILHCSVIKICDDTAITRRSTDADKRYVLNYAVCADCAEQSTNSHLEILDGVSAAVERAHKPAIEIEIHHSERNVTFRRFKSILQIQVVCQKNIAIPTELFSDSRLRKVRFDVFEFLYGSNNLRAKQQINRVCVEIILLLGNDSHLLQARTDVLQHRLLKRNLSVGYCIIGIFCQDSRTQPDFDDFAA